MKSNRIGRRAPPFLVCVALAASCGGGDDADSTPADASTSDAATSDAATSDAATSDAATSDVATSDVATPDAAISDAADPDAWPGPLACDFPTDFGGGRLVHVCDPTEAALCRTFVPFKPSDPRCGDNDDLDFTLSRFSGGSNLKLFKNWKVNATTHGKAGTSGGLERVSAMPGDTDIVVTLDVGDGTLYDFAFRFNIAAGTTTLTSFTAK